MSAIFNFIVTKSQSTDSLFTSAQQNYSVPSQSCCTHRFVSRNEKKTIPCHPHRVHRVAHTASAQPTEAFHHSISKHNELPTPIPTNQRIPNMPKLNKKTCMSPWQSVLNVPWTTQLFQLPLNNTIIGTPKGLHRQPCWGSNAWFGAAAWTWVHLRTSSCEQPLNKRFVQNSSYSWLVFQNSNKPKYSAIELRGYQSRTLSMQQIY